MKFTRPLDRIAALLLAQLVAVTSLQAAVHGINASGTSFSPSSLTINVGDTARWTFFDGPHTTTSNTGLWNSGSRSGGTFEHTFNSLGTFGYYCEPHIGFGMTGTIAVQAPVNQPPTATLTAPGTVKLTVNASDPDGTVTRVDFFAGSTLLGVAVKAPFEITVTPNSGPNSITAAGILVDLGGFTLGGFSSDGSIVGRTTLTTSTAGALMDGRTCFNIHTAANGGGEIRGQILP